MDTQTRIPGSLWIVPLALSLAMGATDGGSAGQVIQIVLSALAVWLAFHEARHPASYRK